MPSAQPRTRSLLTDGDLTYAREDALLQLRIGRTAQYYALILYVLLFADGIVVVAYNQPLPAALTDQGVSAATALYAALFAGLPLVGAGLLSFFGLYVKWEEYQLWPWEPHFWITVLSVAGFGTLTFLYIASLGNIGPTGAWTLFPWLYPLELLVISAALIGMALTWHGFGQRQIIAVSAASIPVVLALTNVASPGSAEGVTLTLLAAAGLYLFSGSWLHLISTGTQAHQRELLSSNESRVFRLADDLRKREDALQFRETALIRREADAESTERALGRQKLAHADVESQLKNYERDVETRAAALRQELQRAAVQLSDLSQREQAVDRDKADVARRDKDLRSWESQRADREATLGTAENSLLQRELALSLREREAAAAPDVAAQAAAQLQLVNAREAELRQREERLTQRETTAGGAAGAGAATAEGGPKAAQSAAWKAALDAQAAALQRRAAELDARTQDVQRQSQELQRRDQAAAARDVQLQKRDSDGSNERQRFEAQRRELEARAAAVATDQTAVARRIAESEARSEELRHKQALVEAREGTLRQRQEELMASQAELTGRDRRAAEREKILDARAAEMTLERQRSEDAGTTLIGMPAALRDREAGPAEEPVPWMTPPAEVEEPPSPPALPSGSPSLQRIPGGRKIARVPTGIPRLDDVLQGGYPANGHVLLLGPPFLGREVAVNSFLADGLRRGERVVVVTTARTPVELASEMGLILPQFKEYEQNGRVTWVDATNPTGSPTSAGGDDGRHFVVKGPGDFTGLLSTITTALQDPRAATAPTPVRVAFTHLSACLAHGEDADAFAFVNSLVSILKSGQATTVSGIDPATVPPKRVEQLLNRVDGAVVFESDAGRTWLSVRGMGDLVYRQRIEYRATSTSLVLGSLALERIR